MTPQTSPTLSRSDVADPRRLATLTRELGLPGQRSMTAIRRLRRERTARAAEAETLARIPTVAERLKTHLTARYIAEITRRGGETGINNGAFDRVVAITDRRDGLAVLHASGWRTYSRRTPARRAALSYLCGVDDAGPWAARVAGTITTVPDALAWLTPAAVTHAQQQGLRVRRQGDIYAVETTARRDTPSGWIGEDARIDPATGQRVTSHYWDADARTLLHRPADGRQHQPLHLPPYPVRFCQQRTLAMGRGTGWGAGD